MGAVLILMGAASCVGVIEDPGGSGPAGGPSGPDAPAPLTCGEVEAPRHRLLRLGHDAWRATVDALVGIEGLTLPAAPGEERRVAGFDAPTQAEPSVVRAWWDGAEVVAAHASSDPEALMGCDSETLACRSAFVADFGRRVHRRPLTDQQQQQYLELYEAARLDGASAQEATRDVVHAMLLSPHFLFRLEEAPPGAEGTVALDDWAVASRLSFFLWGQGPDEALLDAAEAGDLQDPTRLGALVDRMLDDERARRSVERFAAQWLELSSLAELSFDPELVPGHETDASQRALGRALEAQVTDHLTRLTLEGGSLMDLFQGSVLWVTPETAPVFGLSSASLPPEGALHTFDPAERSGVLSLPGVLAAHGSQLAGRGTSPIHRGVWVAQRLLCGSLPPPPSPLPDFCAPSCVGDSECGDYVCRGGRCVSPDASACDEDRDCGGRVYACLDGVCAPSPSFCIPARTGDQTTRQYWDSFDGSCHSCHRAINGVGYGLESYDGLGRFRLTETTTEGDEPIDDRGEILAFGGVTADAVGEFEGLPGLAEVLAGSEAGRACFSRNWFTFAFSQTTGTHDGARCTHAEIHEAFAASGYELRALLRAIALSNGFRHQTMPSEAEEER